MVGIETCASRLVMLSSSALIALKMVINIDAQMSSTPTKCGALGTSEESNHRREVVKKENHKFILKNTLTRLTARRHS